MDKTIAVTIQQRMLHPKYGKYVKKNKNTMPTMKTILVELVIWLKLWRLDLLAK